MLHVALHIAFHITSEWHICKEGASLARTRAKVNSRVLHKSFAGNRKRLVYFSLCVAHVKDLCKTWEFTFVHVEKSWLSWHLAYKHVPRCVVIRHHDRHAAFLFMRMHSRSHGIHVRTVRGATQGGTGCGGGGSTGGGEDRGWMGVTGQHVAQRDDLLT